MMTVICNRHPLVLGFWGMVVMFQVKTANKHQKILPYGVVITRALNVFWNSMLKTRWG
ncbi:MAG: hypothetical protein K8L99_22290 [Anaerolineae bacterium]|nr:hypothetical protein [Anaerolineae bacterium]